MPPCYNYKKERKMADIILQARDLCKSFSSEGVQNHVLNNMDLDIYKGDFTVIMGASGSGKSTLLYSLSGMDRPTSGKVIYDGEDITEYNEKRMAELRVYEFGFVFQQIHLVSNLSIRENILVPGYMNKNTSTKETENRADELIKKMNIESAADRLPAQVSGGEAQRGAIARAVINSPGILFADEPTGALNRRNTQDVLDLLTELNVEGQSILMVTHDVRAAIRANRIIYIEDGRIIGELKLSQYIEEDRKRRESQIDAWLGSMQW